MSALGHPQHWDGNHAPDRSYKFPRDLGFYCVGEGGDYADWFKALVCPAVNWIVLTVEA